MTPSTRGAYPSLPFPLTLPCVFFFIFFLSLPAAVLVLCPTVHPRVAGRRSFPAVAFFLPLSFLPARHRIGGGGFYPRASIGPWIHTILTTAAGAGRLTILRRLLLGDIFLGSLMTTTVDHR